MIHDSVKTKLLDLSQIFKSIQKSKILILDKKFSNFQILKLCIKLFHPSMGAMLQE